MYKKIILICGMPRSGTSWVGQIFDSSPNVAFRMEPLFAYRFKNIINEKSSKDEIAKFFTEVYLSDDDFIHQKENRVKGAYYSFLKNPKPEFLVVKTTRHHNLLERYLRLIDSIEIVSIVRHPCAVINSWINTEREFLTKGCKVENDWRSGRCRKDGEGEFWGFDDWLSVTIQHVKLSQAYSNFNIVKYEDIVSKSEVIISNLFERLSLPYTKQTADFLRACHSKHHDDPYSVYKSKEVANKWKDELNSEIAKEIIKETVESGLSQFVE
jgi:hypothetical protein